MKMKKIKEVYELIDKQNAIITPIIDGTFISVYKYQGKVYYSTKKALEAAYLDGKIIKILNNYLRKQ